MLHGVLIIDKPPRMTSAQVVERVRRRVGAAKAGHTGTLDPLATGVLPIVLGHATKLAGYLIAEDKAYEAELVLGVETDTFDRDGAVVSERVAQAEEVSDRALLEAVEALRQVTEQVPPMYSAVKQGGVRLYERARAGEQVERAPRPMKVHRLEVTWRRGRTVGLSVHCSKGTFVRSLVADLGRALQVGAHLTELRRTQSGAFTLERAVALSELTPELAASHLIPPAAMLDLPVIAVAAPHHGALRDGRRDVLATLTEGLAGRGQLVDERGALLAVVERDAVGARYLRVLL